MGHNIFSERLNEAMMAQGIKQVEIIRQAEMRGTRLGKSQVSQYVSGKTVPRSNVLDVLADVLHVSADWLLGKESPGDGEMLEQGNPSITTSRRDKKRGPAVREFAKS